MSTLARPWYMMMRAVGTTVAWKKVEFDGVTICVSTISACQISSTISTRLVLLLQSAIKQFVPHAMNSLSQNSHAGEHKNMQVDLSHCCSTAKSTLFHDILLVPTSPPLVRLESFHVIDLCAGKGMRINGTMTKRTHSSMITSSTHRSTCHSSTD